MAPFEIFKVNYSIRQIALLLIYSYIYVTCTTNF